MLNALLPQPSRPYAAPAAPPPTTQALRTLESLIPPYGMRAGWRPRSAADFGDGGAFPEIHVPQYPMNMGLKGQSNALQVEVDAEGRIKYDVVLRQGGSQDKVIHHQLTDLLPKQVLRDDDLQKPDEQTVEETTEATRAALQALTQSKIAAALPVRHADKTGPAQYIRYTPSAASDQRIIRLVEVQRDPMEPPRFKINKKIPQAPPSPPPPVMHSPTRKVSVREQQEWRIPPCVSNWKNAKGYTIPLDKRLAADGRGLQQVHINENFAKLSEALYVADRKARESVEARAQMERKMAQKEREKKEDHLRLLAQRAREERAGIRHEATEEAQERHVLRHERHKERQRDRNIQRAAPEKRSRLERERERDVSEQIALGVARPKTGQDVAFDQRLFDQSRGLASGFGDDDEYGVYDKPWRASQQVAQNIYRPSKSVQDDTDDLEAIARTQRFVADKTFSGVDQNAAREGPVQFERQEEEDPFGLDKFLTEVKRASKRPEPEARPHKKRKE